MKTSGIVILPSGVIVNLQHLILVDERKGTSATLHFQDQLMIIIGNNDYNYLIDEIKKLNSIILTANMNLE